MESSPKTQVGAYEAKTRLAELLDQVESGGRITITRHGRPVAQLIPIPGGAEGTVDEAVDALIAFRREHALASGISIGDLLREARKG
jgi:prevent-host-death family protein